MSKKTFKKPKNAQSLYFLLIFLSGGGLIYLKTLPENNQNIWVLLLLLLVLMYSLLKSTRNWAFDNPKDKVEVTEKKREYKNPSIPSLEEMIQKKKETKK